MTERRLRRFIIDYLCSYCPHEYKWGKGAQRHELKIKAYTVGEAVLKAEKDPYITREGILGVREQTYDG